MGAPYQVMVLEKVLKRLQYAPSELCPVLYIDSGLIFLGVYVHRRPMPGTISREVETLARASS